MLCADMQVSRDYVVASVSSSWLLSDKAHVIGLLDVGRVLVPSEVAQLLGVVVETADVGESIETSSFPGFGKGIVGQPSAL